MPHEQLDQGPRPFRLRAVLFDFDGTLTQPDALDFAAIKRELGCPPDEFVLEWIEALPGGPRRAAAVAALERFELDGAAASAAQRGRRGPRAAPPGRRAEARRAHAQRARRRRRSPSGASRRSRRPTSTWCSRATTACAPKPAADGVLHAAAAMGVRARRDARRRRLPARRAGGARRRRASPPTSRTAPPERRRAAPTPTRSAARRAPPATSWCTGSPSSTTSSGSACRCPPASCPTTCSRRHLRGFGRPAIRPSSSPPGSARTSPPSTSAALETIVVHGDPITLASRRPRPLRRARQRQRHRRRAAPSRAGCSPRSCCRSARRRRRRWRCCARSRRRRPPPGVTLVGGHTEVADAVTRPVVAATTIGVVAPRRAARQARRARRRPGAAHQRRWPWRARRCSPRNWASASAPSA